MNGGGALGGRPSAVALAPDDEVTGEVTLTLTSWRPPGAARTPDQPAPRPAGEPVPGPAGDHLLDLAERLAAATPEAAHDLFTDAFGLYSARHFGIAPEPPCADLAAVSWWHGPPVGRRSLPGARRGRRAARA
ncbi:DUF2397 family protein, partial [Kitasatospora sp. LaBMicrA B282]|uniref:DUF2397 family protein n=1 Tax=Kitasatospora sp. LaBMicrA B282 TaxID=3420949 RepID=UPI003D126248